MTASKTLWGIQLYRVSEDLTEVLIYLLVVFTPWAFGTTQAWSIWTLSIAGYALALLFAVKLSVRQCLHYNPSKWGSRKEGPSPPHSRTNLFRDWQLTAALAALTIMILGYCLVSAVNARATFQNHFLTFEYRECVRWLPHSLDAGGTWFAFWGYLGLAGVFWGVWDWLLGKSDGEERAEWRRGRSADPVVCAATAGDRSGELRTSGVHAGAPFPARLRRLLWLLAINGALLGVEGIVQRSLGSSELLFLVKPRIHQTAETQFGPYAYRSNAAQYFNLLWPVCLGFWWTLNRNCARKNRTHHALLVCAAIMAACPIISTSRGGALVTAGLGVLAALFLVVGYCRFSVKARKPRTRSTEGLLALSLFFTAVLALGLSLGWKALRPRMADLDGGLEGREALYAAARPMAADYPWFGTGPGTFETVSQLYPRSDAYWRPQLHNDWLETRITFGRIGCALLALAFAVVLLRWFAPGGIHGGRRFVLLTWLALAGCFVHARFDFPFQVHSILFLVVVLGAMLFVLSRRR